ncbi:MAG: hypothetical protein EAZ57_04575 [Cytophagales bacterium]|nr:MAG: hypothetical protein EAZ57_04575 [Cytophagales bacterium]
MTHSRIPHCRVAAFILFVGLLGGFHAIFAQEQKLSEIEASVQREAFNFAKAYSDLSITKDIPAVVQYMAPELLSTVILHDLQGNIRVIHSDYESFRNYLNKMVQTDGLSIKYNITKVHQLRVHDDTLGVIVYEADYDSKRDTTAWSKGSEIVTMTLKRVGTDWYVIHFTTLAIEDNFLKGACFCEIFGNPNGEFVMQTIMPAAKTYTESSHKVKFWQTAKERFMRVDDRLYRWMPNEDVWAVNERQTDVQFIGYAKTNQELLRLVLQKDIFITNCSQIHIAYK